MSTEVDLDFARNVIRAEGEAVLGLVGRVGESFVDAARLVYDCRGTVVLTGIGKAGLIAQKISATLASTGTPSYFLHPVEAVHGDLGRLRGDDIVIALSRSGQTDEIIRLINLVRGMSLPLIAIVGDTDSPLARYAEAVLDIGSVPEACANQLAPSVSTSSMLAMGDALALTVSKMRNFTRADFAAYHPGGSLGRELVTVEQIMEFHTGAELPLAEDSLTVQQALERTRSVKRLGAVLLVDEHDRLSGILTDGDLRRLLQKHGPGVLSRPVAEVMTKRPLQINRKALASEALAIFIKHRIDDLPVVDDDGRPVGMLDVQDLTAIKLL